MSTHSGKLYWNGAFAIKTGEIDFLLHLIFHLFNKYLFVSYCVSRCRRSGFSVSQDTTKALPAWSSGHGLQAASVRV